MSWVSPRVIRGNRGDIASRFGILSEMIAADASVSAVFAARVEHTPAALRDKCLPYGPVYNLFPAPEGRRALKRAKFVVWTGGLDLQDDSSLIKLVHTWFVFLSYRFRGLKIMLAHQGAGPLTTSLGRWLARRILGCVSLALMRDTGSHRLLATLMPSRRVRLAGDGIFLGGFPTREDGHIIPRVATLLSAEGRQVVGVNIRQWFHFNSSLVPYQFARKRYLARAEAKMDALLNAVAAMIARLRRRGARVLLISMYEPGVEPWEDDAPLLARLKARFQDDAEVVVCDDDFAIADLCALLGRLDLMIGMRLHSTLIALRCGAPALHLSYTLKGRDIFGDLGLADWVFDVDDAMAAPDAAAARAEAILNDAGRFERVRASVTPAVEANRKALRDALAAVEAS